MTDPVTVQPTRDQLRALADAATPGPWRIGEAFTEPASWVAHLADDGWDDRTTVTSQDATARDDQEVCDAEFIAAARTAVPALLDALEQAEADSEKRGELVARALAVSETWRKRTVRAEAQSETRRRQTEYWQKRIRDLTQEVRDERGAARDQMEQVRIRDARIRAVEDVIDQWQVDGYDALRRRIRRALEG